MKRLMGLLLALGLLAVLAACGHFVPIMPGTDPVIAGTETPVPEDAAPAEDVFETRPLMSFIGWDSFATSYYDDTPIALSIYTPERGYASPVFDRASIVAACDALRSMSVTGRAEGAPIGGETTFIFTMENGVTWSVTFAGTDLKMPSTNYTVSGGDNLWALTFPGYSEGYDLFDLYFDAGVRAFADDYYNNRPVSVGRRMNGGATLTSQDPAIVDQVFQLLANARIDRIETSPDQNIDLTQTTDYVFSLPDASYYTFSFAGPCLAVTVSEDYGTVYYWLNGLEQLPETAVLPESRLPTFSGGQLTALREDIALAQQAAFNELGGVTVIGVFVSYTINGQDGYLTLSGNTAAQFVQQVTTITASAEQVAPQGEEITVSVTLSDESGPILYFIGDSIQQVVGTNYACDANAMANLRSYILSLAQDPNNISGIIGESTG